MSQTGVLIVCASPHKGGTTERLARILQDGLARDATHVEVTLLHLAGKKLSGCLHCGACKKGGICSLARTDDCEAAFSAMRNASLVLWLSPVYFYGLPAQAKALIDRSQRFYESRACEHSKAANALCPRALSLFVSGRRKGDMLFAGSHLALKYFFAALGITYAGSLALRGLEAPSDVIAETKQDLLRAAKILAHSIEKDCPDIARTITKACPRIENALPAYATNFHNQQTNNSQISQGFTQGMTL